MPLQFPPMATGRRFARHARRLRSASFLPVIIAILGFISIEAFSSPPLVWGQGTLRRGEPRFGIRPFQDQHRKLAEEYQAGLIDLHRRCLEEQAQEEAAEIAQLLEAAEAPGAIDGLPENIQSPLPGDLPANERSRRQALLNLRKRYAADLFTLAAKCKRQGYLSLAYDLIREAAVHNSDHPQVRKLLGYVRHDNRWVTPVAQALLKDHKTWHPDFGWIPKNHVERYESGERNVDGRWMSAVKEADIRRDFRKAWEIRTDHYLIKTNHSLARGVELGQALEEFYRYFVQAFHGFFDAAELENAVRSGGTFRPYVVHYYRTRDEYNQTLKAKIPQIAITNGLYYTSDRIAYFFDDPNANGLATLYHEASHQLFYESQKNDRAIADAAHFWIIEGIACYLESFRSEEGEISIGDPNFERFLAARIRLFQEDSYYVPLAQFSSMGMKAFQTDSNIQMNYSQASGLAHFFMNYDAGIYRDALIEHLKELYDGPRKNGHRTLEDLTGVNYETLDQQYREYLTEMEQAANRRAAAR